jgi:hypothetical protein
MKAKPLLLTLLLLTLLGTGAQARDIDVAKLPGYVDLKDIRIPEDAEAIRDIDLGPPLLKMAAEADTSRQSALTRVLSQLQLVRVKSFAFRPEDAGEVRSHVRDIEDRLEKNDWSRLIRVRDEEDSITLSVKYDQNHIVGLMLVAFSPDDEEVTFVNVVGHLDLASLAGLTAELSGVDMDDFLDELDNR